MLTAAMVKQQPPSPAPSNNAELQYGLHHLVHHNSNLRYQADQYNADDGRYVHSEPQTAYGSPAAGQYPGQQYVAGPYEGVYQDSNDVGLGIQFDGYGAPIYYPNQHENYSSVPVAQQSYLNQGFHVNSPPTPTFSDQSNGGRRTTRSGRSIAGLGTPQTSKVAAQEKLRAPRSPKVKKSSKSKADKPKAPKIHAPLSELTKAFDSIPVRNMEEWVNRSVEVRLKEVEKRNGYVTRPMNSFMLYRSAYADRTKLWCLQNNHQIVSSVSGESWPLEPPQVREQYNEYARIERDNHQKAHPGYKFSPSKAQGAGRKRKGTSEDEAEEPSDLDDPEFNWGAPSQRKSRMKQSKRQIKEAGYPANSILQHNFGGRPLEPRTEWNKSSYQATNPGKTLPAAMGNNELFGQYYQTTIHPNLSAPNMNIEDVRIRKTETPGMQYSNQPLIGLPGGHHYELLQQHSHTSSPAPMEQTQLDPQLLAYDNDLIGHSGSHLGGVDDGNFGGLPSDPGFNNPYEVASSDYNQHSFFNDSANPIAYQTTHTLHPGNEGWQVDADAGPLDVGAEFDKWMEEHNNR